MLVEKSIKQQIKIIHFERRLKKYNEIKNKSPKLISSINSTDVFNQYACFSSLSGDNNEKKTAENM